jgi:hypothetical protein
MTTIQTFNQLSQDEQELVRVFRMFDKEKREMHLYLLRCSAERAKTKKANRPALRLINNANSSHSGA